MEPKFMIELILNQMLNYFLPESLSIEPITKLLTFIKGHEFRLNSFVSVLKYQILCRLDHVKQYTKQCLK